MPCPDFSRTGHEAAEAEPSREVTPLLRILDLFFDLSRDGRLTDDLRARVARVAIAAHCSREGSIKHLAKILERELAAADTLTPDAARASARLAWLRIRDARDGITSTIRALTLFGAAFDRDDTAKDLDDLVRSLQGVAVSIRELHEEAAERASFQAHLADVALLVEQRLAGMPNEAPRKLAEIIVGELAPLFDPDSVVLAREDHDRPCEGGTASANGTRPSSPATP